jgi:hypothetical protein
MKILPKSALVFSGAEEGTKLLERFKDYFRHYRAETEKKNYSYDTSVSLLEKEQKVNELMKKEISKLANVSTDSVVPIQAYMTNPQYIWATYAIINVLVDMILPETIIDSIGLYTDVRVGDYGDSFAFDIEPRDLFIVTKSGKGKRKSEATKQFEGQVTVIPVEHDITVQTSLYKVLAGEENLAKFTMKAVRSLETQMTLDVYNAFATAMSALTASATLGNVLRYTGYSQAKAVRLAQTVSGYNQGAKAIFLGTQSALSTILPADTNFRYSLEDDYVKIGYIRTAFGFDCMVLPQVIDWRTEFKVALDDTKIYVISPSSQKPIKLCIEGQMLAITTGIYDNADLTQTTTLKKMYATGLATSAVYGIIDL